ncbi:MAG TPA: DUF1549 domain-containing protein, partial [Planctomycetaceae bacterium]|nr:DUF1549 domain-containing protein [Planctomycetaceae bacterium]
MPHVQRLRHASRAMLLSRMVALLAACWIGGTSWAVGGEPRWSGEDIAFFEKQVRPLLVRRCLSCHGENKQESGLRLDAREHALKGGESGPAIVEGKPDESLLIEAVRYESLEMPPEQRLSESEVRTLEEWIRRGVPWPDGPQASLRRSRGHDFTPAERSYWAFQPVRAWPTPAVRNLSWCRNAIDRFVLARLESEGLTPAPPADRRTLIRRVYFDVIGLPPGPEEIEAFLLDPADEDIAYERMVDRLLASPHFGERMAQMWLDLVRFAESDGYRADAFRTPAWRYRDYVVSAFNSDKPYDRFVMEQLAGDELAPDDPDVRIATTFLRLGVYESNQRDARFHWTLIVDELTDVIGETFLGLSMACARCHDHKFDPILRKDYYRLRACFAPLLFDDDTPVASADVIADHRKKMEQWERQTAKLQAQLARIEDPILRSLEQFQVAQFPEDVQAIYAKPESQRNWLERQLAYLVHRQVLDRRADIPKKLKGEKKKEWEDLRKKLDASRPPPLPRMMTVRDAGGAATATQIPGTETVVEPGPLSILDSAPFSVQTPEAAPNSTGRRLALARWLTDPEIPLPARVIVNRIWQLYFGKGIVETPNEFGRMGQPPSHPRLLDYLAWHLVRGDQPWRLKQLHRMILLSSTYRQSTFHPDAAQNLQRDPENRWLWHAATRRLSAEQLRDLLWSASGQLDRRIGGLSVSGMTRRRSIYVRRMRNSPDPL